MPRQIVPSTDKIYQEDFPKVVSEGALRKEEWAAPFFKFGKKTMLRQIFLSIDKIYQ